MAKLPGIQQRPVGASHARNLPTPDYMGPSRALGQLSAAAASFAKALDKDSDTSAAVAGAANDLSELRAKLETSRQVGVEEVPEEILFPIEMQTFDENGDGREEVRPFAFTHEVADEWWALKSEEIIRSYASQIADPQDRADFVDEVSTRWVIPGTLAINKASITKRVAHNRGQAEVAIDSVLASNLPNEEKEAAAIGIIDRHTASGGDPIWAASKKSGLGPAIDQIDYQNQMMREITQEGVEDVRDDMWAGDNRMSPEQLRALDAQADQRIKAINDEEKKFMENNASDLWVGIDRGQVTIPDVTQALETRRIDITQHNMMINALTEGSSTNASNPLVLSSFRGRIVQIPYTGNVTTVREQGRVLKNRIMMASRGLTPVGQPDGLPASISGTDAAKLMDEVDVEVNRALKTQDYDRAWQEIQVTLRVNPGVTGMADDIIYGDQPSVDAAMAFKRALDTYMDSYGIDAKPIDFVETNRSTYTAENFTDPINREFVALYPAAINYMTETDGKLTFAPVDRDRFRNDMAAQYRAGTIGVAELNEISARYDAYYNGRGMPPIDTARSIETPDALYRR